MENQVTVSDIRPPLQPAPELPPLGHDSGDRIPADELLPGVKQLLDAPESRQYEDCKDSVEHHRHSGNWPVVLGHQDQNEVADAPKEATAHIRQTVPHAPFLADRGIRDRAVLADPGVSGPNAVAMGSIPSVADCEREIAAPLLPREQANPVQEQQVALLPSEQAKAQADWLKSLLPTLSAGWWDVAANGKGFIIKQKWREGSKQITQTYPRVSREQYETLQGSNYARFIAADIIAGHLDECRKSRDAAKRERAIRASERVRSEC